MARTKSGFTIVELLIVIVIIGILATITIVAYNGIQERARASAATSALTQAIKKIALWQVDNPGMVPPDLATTGVTNSSDVSYQYSQTNSATGYCITATVGSTSYYLNTTSSNQGTPASGGCAGHGVGGVQAITNLVTNPSFENGIQPWWVTWGASGAGTAAVMTNGGWSGNNYKRVTWTTAPTGAIQTGLDNTAVTAGKVYTFSLYVRQSWAGNQFANISFRDYANTSLLTSSSGVVSMSAGQWTRLSVSGTAPVTAIKATLYIQSNSSPPPVNGTLDVDGVMLTEGSATSQYADGNSPNWVWNGTINNSSSTGPQL